MLGLFIRGGWVMYPLLVFSVLALGVILERGFYFFLSRQRLDRFLKALGCEGNTGELFVLKQNLKAQNSRGYLTQMTQVYFDCIGEEAASEKLFAAGSEIIRKSEKRLSVLASIAHLAPLCGLFGTVLGMIEVFRKLESIGGRADVGLLSGGIWVALLTTAFGLLIAIPTLIAHHYFSDQVSERSEDLQFLISRLNVHTGAALSMDSKEDAENLYEAISAT
ncbi:MAG: MotA/TolQ/ExbB proton channel family protein [Treponema sp.]|jgi:biopolymer transport protein ExbB|nr:MotA/TolQ/ExbB proton channel family protein [Treponema sp.]